MADEQEMFERAREWLREQDVPLACPECDELKRWEVTEAVKVDRHQWDKKTGQIRAVEDPELYLVLIFCRHCGHIERIYAEDVPLAKRRPK